jgi:hypothetical protein
VRVCGFPHSQRFCQRSPVAIANLHPLCAPEEWTLPHHLPADGAAASRHGILGRMILRMMRDPANRGPAPLARLVALLLVVGLVALSAPVLIPVVRWIVDLL